MAQQVNPEAVIARLASQVGQMAAEVAMRDVALDDAQKRIDELEKAAAPRSTYDTPVVEAPAA